MGKKIKCTTLQRGFFLMLCMMLCIFQLFSVDVGAKKKVRVKRVSIKSNYGKIVHVGKGKKVKVQSKVTVRPNKSSNKGVRYRSKNKKIARVNSIGEVRGVKLGTTRIYAVSKKNSKKKASIKVRVVKPVTKIILKETEKTVKTGEHFEIKKKVVPSNSGFKKLVWSSSVPTVAKVSAEGKVTALRPGNAKITARAVDGSGTKAVCKVTVQSADTINMTSVRVLSQTTVRVSFDKPVSLDKSHFSVTGKFLKKGNGNKQYKIKRLRNYDNTSYDIKVEKDYTFEKNMTLRIRVDSLPGNGTKSIGTEVCFVRETPPPDRYVTGESGSYLEPVTVDLSDYGYGSLRYEVNNLPAGVEYRICDNAIMFTGRAQTSYFGKTTVITAEDEMDRKFAMNLYWYIGSKEDIVGYARDISFVTGEEAAGKKSEFITLAGGSGEYTYQFSGLPDGIKGDTQTGALTGSTSQAGEYQVQVSVSDTKDAKRRIAVSAKMTVETGFTLWGRVQDSAGLAMSGIRVAFTSQDGSNRYSAVTDSDGNYTVRVVGDEYYGEASVNSGDVISDEIYEYVVKRDSCVEFYPDCYRVNIHYDSQKYVLEDGWKSNVQEGVSYDGSSVIYAAPGHHDLYAYACATDKNTGEKQRYMILAEFTITSGSASIEAVVTEIPEEGLPGAETGKTEISSTKS